MISKNYAKDISKKQIPKFSRSKVPTSTEAESNANGTANIAGSALSK